MCHVTIPRARRQGTWQLGMATTRSWISCCWLALAWTCRGASLPCMALWAALPFTLLPSMDTSRFVNTLLALIPLRTGPHLHGCVDSTVLLIVAQHGCQHSGNCQEIFGALAVCLVCLCDEVLVSLKLIPHCTLQLSKDTCRNMAHSTSYVVYAPALRERLHSILSPAG